MIQQHNNPLYLILLTLILCMGCAKEEINDMPRYAGSTVDLKLELSRNVGGNEIKDFRILVFHEGDLVSDSRFFNSSDDTPSTQVKVAKGVNNFYVFCNETPSLKTAIDNIEKESEIANITYLPPSGKGIKVPMHGQVLGANVEVHGNGVNVTVNGVTKPMLPVQVDRMMAKLSITFIKNIASVDDDFVIKNIKINVHKLPKMSSLKDQMTYTSSEWLNPLSFSSTNSINNNGEYTVVNGSYSLAEGIDNITFADIYLPEHYLTDKTKEESASYLSIDATCSMNNSSEEFQMAYIVKLGQSPPNNYNLPRNNHINIYATIRKIGEGITTAINLAPWKDGGTIDVEQPKEEPIYYLNMSESLMKYPHIIFIDKDFNYFLNDESGNKIEITDHDQTIYFWTNKPTESVSITDFMWDNENSKPIESTNSMTILRNNIVGNTHDVMGKVDIHISKADIIEGIHSPYSMRLKADKIDRKISIATTTELVPTIIQPSFTKLTDLVLKKGTSSSTSSCTTESFEIEAFCPNDYKPYVYFSSMGSYKFTPTLLTPTDSNPFDYKRYKITYTNTSPYRATLGTFEVKIQLMDAANKTVYEAPFTLSLTARQ